MVSEPLEVSNYRYERKFVVSELTKHEVESIVKLHPVMFSEIYHQRFVNNIYFDGVNLKSYFDNVDGNHSRIKMRIRWYGELFGDIEKPALELKIKNGLLGRKESFSLYPFELNGNFNIQTISGVIEKSDIPEIIKIKLRSSYPTLLNRYSRRYFQSADGNYRITIDTDQTFYRISYHNNSFLSKLTDDASVILELKYDEDMDNNSDHITAYFPFRLSRSSKYASGFAKLYNW